jgi:hypothetical protein
MARGQSRYRWRASRTTGVRGEAAAHGHGHGCFLASWICTLLVIRLADARNCRSLRSLVGGTTDPSLYCCEEFAEHVLGTMQPMASMGRLSALDMIATARSPSLTDQSNSDEPLARNQCPTKACT